MKPAEQALIAYGVAFAGAAAVSYFRGRSMTEVLMDTALHGAIAGTALVVVGWLLTEQGAVPVLAHANNSEPEGTGKVGQGAVALLANLNPDEIFSQLKEQGVKIAPVPDNPSIINQDEH